MYHFTLFYDYVHDGASVKLKVLVAKICEIKYLEMFKIMKN